MATPSWSPAPILMHEGSNTTWRCAAVVARGAGLAAAVMANRDTDECAALAPADNGPGGVTHV